tara:strand:- start:5688 stop:6920 length:1233 start_codon:yes stop_codon:yes gene_type:complete
MFKSPKGTVDYLPEEQATKNYIINIFKMLSSRYGFKEVESPAFEELKLLTNKSGDEIKKQIFTLEKKGEEDLGLRFDLTVPLTRMYVEQEKSLPKPVKWSYATRMWRYERPQAGRLREFYQVGVELFGSDDARADAEVINLILDFFQTLGFNENDIELRINNRKLLEGLLLEEVLPNKIAEVIRVIDKKEKIPKEAYLEELKKIGIRDPGKLDKLLEMDLFERLENLDKNALATEGYNELKAIWPLIQKKFVRLSLSTARGLDYYSGTVFEVFDKGGKFRSLCGGGRYDNMVEQFGSKSPGTGFSIGLATLTLLLKDKKKLPEGNLGVEYFVAAVEGFEKEAFDLVGQLRSKYSVETDLSGRNLGNQVKFANTIGAKYLIVFGEDEKKGEKVKIKDLATGKEEIKPIKSL